MTRAGSILMLVVGVLLCLSALAHAFVGWPAIRQALGEAGVDPELALGIGTGWLYGSSAMLTFGVLTIASWGAVRRGNANAGRVMWPVAGLYLLFGTAAYFATSFEPHFLGFIAIGALAAVAAYAVTRST
jgi:hypothetical protein